MSHQLIARSPDLKRLRDEGYDVEVRAGFLLVKNVPYVNAARQVLRGTLVSELTLAGDVTTTPNTHVATFSGEAPCNCEGAALSKVVINNNAQELAPGLKVQHTFSSKPLPPQTGYPDYYVKMTQYIAILSDQARAIDPTVTAQIYPAVVAEETESVFCYIDIASSRAQIVPVTAKLETGPVAIVGVGGSGAYVLDLIAKTPVQEIHLFDADVFSQHNAFRAPGAASLEQLRARPTKVDYLTTMYSAMRRKIHPHPVYVTAANIAELAGMTFVFLCIDSSDAKKVIVDFLIERGIPFVDVGMGVNVVDGALTGIVRTTTVTPQYNTHVQKRISFASDDGNEYVSNIQIAELNALNAVMAVIRWKKLLGFYADLEKEHSASYAITGNELLNEDQSCPE